MIDDTIKNVKDEVRFFMDKSFQSSFAYIGALVAAVFSIKVDTSAIRMLTSLDPSLLFACVVLLINFIFMTVSIGCSFAVVKRGMFIVASFEQDVGNADVEWETFLRTRAGHLGWIAWNIDNFYLVPIVGIVVGLSLVIFGTELQTLAADTDKWAPQYLLLIIPMALHAWPAWSFWQLARLIRDHGRLIERFGGTPQARRLMEVATPAQRCRSADC